MDKNEVRQLIMNRRHELSDEDIEMQSGLIIDRLKKSDIYKTSENVFLYMSYNREVDTYMLLSQCFMDGRYGDHPGDQSVHGRTDRGI